MERAALDHFGAFLVRNLRDRAIEGFDLLESAHWRAPGLQALQADLAKLSPEQRQIARRALINSIDRAIHEFLFALQEQPDSEEGIRIRINNVDVVAASDGVHGEAFGENGWYDRFSAYGPVPSDA